MVMGLVFLRHNSLIGQPVGIGGNTRPVGNQVNSRPGIEDFGNPAHETLDRVILLASQVRNLDLGNFNGLEMVQGAGSNRAGTLYWRLLETRFD